MSHLSQYKKNYITVSNSILLNLLAMNKSDVLILGGGLAGFTAALHLLKNGYPVTVFEKNEFPKHKVCGEYISNEVLPYFKSLDLAVESLHPTQINQLNFSLVSGRSITCDLPLGGFGISRYTLDNYLYQEVLRRGGVVLHEKVIDVFFDDEIFTITTQKGVYLAKTALAAYGKRSNLDVKLDRSFLGESSNWLAVKAHYKVDFPNNLVGLHHFKGGYCGVSKVENDKVNICFLGNYETFKAFKDLLEYQDKVVCQNPNLRAIYNEALLQFEKPLVISQICFDSKTTIESNMLMIGDTAGLIHPLCGNGMAMAIHSAKLACEALIPFLENQVSRTTMEEQYTSKWNKNFRSRLRTGKWLGYLLQQERLAALVMKLLFLFPNLLPRIIKKTHGNPL
jgi:flavin-dependent dehydrogenase